MAKFGSKEPAVGIGATLTGILYALVFIAEGQGLDIADKTEQGVEMLIYAMCAVPAISGLITRFFVYSPSSVEKIADAQHKADPPPAPQPPIPGPADA